MLPDTDETAISDEGEEVQGATSPDAGPSLIADHELSSTAHEFDEVAAIAAESADAEAPADDAEAPADDAEAPVDAVDLPAAVAPLPPPPVYVPKPKPPIRPERGTGAQGEPIWSTDGILIERAAAHAFFITIRPPQGTSAPQRIYVHGHAFDHLVTLAQGQSFDTGRLWRALCDIPIDRPLPSRRLEEELRALLTTFTTDFRG